MRSPIVCGILFLPPIRGGPWFTQRQKGGPVLRRAVASVSTLFVLSLVAGLAIAGVPKLLVLEHFADYFG